MTVVNITSQLPIGFNLFLTVSSTMRCFSGLSSNGDECPQAVSNSSFQCSLLLLSILICLFLCYIQKCSFSLFYNHYNLIMQWTKLSPDFRHWSTSFGDTAKEKTVLNTETFLVLYIGKCFKRTNQWVDMAKFGMAETVLYKNLINKARWSFLKDSARKRVSKDVKIALQMLDLEILLASLCTHYRYRTRLQ